MLGFDSFWVMDHLHQIRGVGKQAEPMLESWPEIFKNSSVIPLLG